MAAKNQRIIVTSPFRHKGEDLGVGTVLDIDLGSAQELRSAKRADFAQADTKIVSVPLAKKVKPSAASDGGRIADLAEEVARLKEIIGKGSAKGKKEMDNA